MDLHSKKSAGFYKETGLILHVCLITLHHFSTSSALFFIAAQPFYYVVLGLAGGLSTEVSSWLQTHTHTHTDSKWALCNMLEIIGMIGSCLENVCYRQIGLKHMVHGLAWPGLVFN